MNKVLIIEDDVNLAKALGYILLESDYDVKLAFNGDEGLELAISNDYDAIILDWMLPGTNGSEICKEIRRKNIDTPICMLTAKNSISAKIEGLDSGADDYMTKPFVPAELLAHIRALTRRKGKVIFETTEYLDLKLDLKSHDLSKDEEQIHLSYKEFAIMKILIENAGQTITKQHLIEAVWGKQSSAEDNNVEAYISFLRKKLKFLKSNTKIETLRKTGYRLVEK